MYDVHRLKFVLRADLSSDKAELSKLLTTQGMLVTSGYVIAHKIIIDVFCFLMMLTMYVLITNFPTYLNCFCVIYSTYLIQFCQFEFH